MRNKKSEGTHMPYGPSVICLLERVKRYERQILFDTEDFETDLQEDFCRTSRKRKMDN